MKQTKPNPAANALKSFLVILCILGFIFLLHTMGPLTPSKPVELDYSQFVSEVEAGKVYSVEILEHQSTIRGWYKTADELNAARSAAGGSVNIQPLPPAPQPPAPKPAESKPAESKTGLFSAKKEEPQRDGFVVRYPNHDQLIGILLKNHVDIKSISPTFMERIGPLFITLALPLIALVVLWMLFMRQTGGGGASQIFSFGKSRAKLFSENASKVTFGDVAGVEEAKNELKEIVEFLKEPKKFTELGAKIPKGVLLVGPPGSGKTLLARAIAGEAGVPFFQVSGSDFVEMFVGVGASRVRDLFQQAMKHSPCLIFIDEIDAVGRQRGAGLGGGHDEREQTLNQLLVEMDGFDPNTGVIMIAATNRPDVLDPALLRPGRFDRTIVVDTPDLEGRKAILEIHARGKPMTEDVDLGVLARRTPGFTGADLENTMNEAAILAAREDAKQINMSHCEEAIDRVVAGPERKSKVISDREKKIIAYHESGHALVARILPNADPVHKISILPRGMALGYTLTLPLEDRYLSSRNEFMDHMAVSLGGRVAEEIVFNDLTTGAHNDLERVTETARKMVTQYGMSDKLGPLTFGKKHEAVFLGRDLAEDRNYSEAIAFEIDKEVRRIIEECHIKARETLTLHRAALDTLANELIKHETMEADELERFLDQLVESGPDSDPSLVTYVSRNAEPKAEQIDAEPAAIDPWDLPPVEESAALEFPADIKLPMALDQETLNAPISFVTVRLEGLRDFLAVKAATEPDPDGVVELFRGMRLRGGLVMPLSEIPDLNYNPVDGINMRLFITLERGLALIQSGDLDAGLKYLMNVAMRSTTSLDPKYERDILSAIRYLKIVKEHIQPLGITFDKLGEHEDLLARINDKIRDREAKLGYPQHEGSAKLS